MTGIQNIAYRRTPHNMICALIIASVLAIATVSNGKIYFKENFNDKSWESRWTVPTEWREKNELGEWKWTTGVHFGDASDKGIQTGEDARFYGLSAKLDETFTNTDKEMVLQMTVKHEQDLDCGGAYIKLLGDMDQAKFGGDTPYQVMFGPDVCGPSNRKTHAIFNYPPKNDNLLIKNELKVETDRLSHVYTLVVKPDNTYEVYIDLESVRSGSLEDSWDFLLPKEIQDPAISKPEDWVDAKKIPDPADSKPDDWDDEEDGEWEAPMVDNPDFNGPWKPNIIVTDSFDEAKAYAESTYSVKKDGEKAMYDAAEAKKAAEAEAARAAAAEEEEGEEEGDEEEDHDEL